MVEDRGAAIITNSRIVGIITEIVIISNRTAAAKAGHQVGAKATISNGATIIVASKAAGAIIETRMAETVIIKAVTVIIAI